MAEPRVPGSRGSDLALPCGESVAIADLDMGMREFGCDCGERHALVMDVHPPSRFVPESLVEVLRETIESEDGDEFDTIHLMGVVLEEFPQKVVAEDVAENSDVGYALVWATDFDARRLHEIVVELIVELMEHAVSHADDDAASEFERQMHEFDVEAFVEQYRREREFERETDTPV
ncbi:DUF5815 family protein [Halococcus saccharolyticus]|uniref:Uncharacterized protein n=1 Tax=Halococcus saccharolyticus DSM 5350 TaxID=1227455 RepID=M0MFB4_9EURY|nr:DUF5815 family protein [Halococcus saccharolyticus]EMA44023.1 hypothetical protein C449_10873 [Halococcus saccharolyticus DSM 5350]